MRSRTVGLLVVKAEFLERVAVALLAVTSVALSACLQASQLLDIQIKGISAVDYHDQQELPIPKRAGLQALVGRDASAHVPSSALPMGASERPHRLMLRISFLSSVDLRALAQNGLVVFLHSYFCSRENEFAVLAAPTVFSNGESVSPEHKIEVPRHAKKAQPTYYFFVNVTRRESLRSKPVEMGFDLRTDPHDVCFYLTGSGARGLEYKSDVSTISKTAITNALRDVKEGKFLPDDE